MFRFEELEIWKQAIEYGKECYKISHSLPTEERYSLSDQLRRAGLSVSNNIAEGSVGSSANFKKYLITSIGSILETVNILHFALSIGYVKEPVRAGMYTKAERLIKMIRGFSRSLE